MESLVVLPEPLEEIEIPTCLGVTKLVAAGPCLLRAAATTPRNLPGPMGGPRAEFGKLAHALSDLAAFGRLGVDGIPTDVTAAFGYLLEQAGARLSASEETRRFADLRVGFTKREWEKRVYFTIAHAEQQAGKRMKMGIHECRKPPGSRPFLLREVVERRLRGAVEVPFTSTALRIRGRIDLVDVSELGEVTVSDFKSGVVADANGEIHTEISLQIRLYGLAVGELTRSDIVLRVLAQNREYSVPFDESEKQSANRWLRERTDRLSPGIRHDAHALTAIGARCVSCRLRPVCPAYRRFVCDGWKRQDNRFKLPLDIAGIITEKGDDGNFVWLKLRDLAGRTVKIHRLDPEHAPLECGQKVWFFDLASFEERRTHRGWRHPCNFHQMASTSTDRTAWKLRGFIETSRA